MAYVPVTSDSNLTNYRGSTSDELAYAGDKQPKVVRKKFATPPVKVACLECRASRTRCDGKTECSSVSDLKFWIGSCLHLPVLYERQSLSVYPGPLHPSCYDTSLTDSTLQSRRGGSRIRKKRGTPPIKDSKSISPIDNSDFNDVSLSILPGSQQGNPILPSLWPS